MFLEAGGLNRAEPSELYIPCVHDVRSLMFVLLFESDSQIMEGNTRLGDTYSIYTRPLALLSQVILVLFRCKCFLRERVHLRDLGL